MARYYNYYESSWKLGPDGAVDGETDESARWRVCSPLCATYLDDAQKMEAKGIKFVRFADDILIFTRSSRH